MRSTVAVANVRRILCVFPAYTPSFGTFQHAYKLMLGVRAFMPPQGLLAIAAYLPEAWDVRFIDENLATATEADFAWADAVFVSGMHIQAPQIRDIFRRARAAGKVTALGGPSVSSAPEMYPEFNYLHVGELGDATDALIRRLDADVAVPEAQVKLETKNRLALSDFPRPAYEQVRLGRYLLGSAQFSSGCPYRCEFCDIPGLYGRQPRMKSPEQLLAELDRFTAQKDHPTMVYFVDDNFIGNRKATKEMLPHLVAWQKKHGYPLTFSCEATLNIAKQPEILALMREAAFQTIFVGIETPELDALKLMQKDHNASLPMLEAIQTLNSYGLEVTSGIIMGLDSDTAESESRLLDFVNASQVPVLTMNLLQALPKTPLWDRLQREGRLTDDPTLESNVKFLRPHDEVVASWRRAIAYAYTPERIFGRYLHQVEATYPNRLALPVRTQLSWINLKRAAVLLKNLIWYLGIKADYRRAFWHAAFQALKKGQIEGVFTLGFVGHHLIEFTREALSAQQNASFYAAKPRQETAEARQEIAA